MRIPQTPSRLSELMAESKPERLLDLLSKSFATARYQGIDGEQVRNDYCPRARIWAQEFVAPLESTTCQVLVTR